MASTNPVPNRNMATGSRKVENGVKGMRAAFAPNAHTYGCQLRRRTWPAEAAIPHNDGKMNHGKRKREKRKKAGRLIIAKRHTPMNGIISNGVPKQPPEPKPKLPKIRNS